MENLNKKRVLLFLILLMLITGFTYYATRFIGNKNISSLVVMWGPAIAALITGVVTKRHIKEIGWKINLKWMAFGWLTPVIYASVAYLLVWLLGLGGVPNPTFLERARFTLGIEHGPDGLVIMAAFFYITLINLIPSMLMGLGEEIGWRGFLVPEMTKWAGFRKASWISGLIWSVWHIPGFFMGDYAASDTPLYFQLVCFIAMVVSTGVIMAWIRMKSSSIWPVAIMHATHNGLIQMFYNRITYDTGHTNYFIGEFGIALALITTVGAWYFIKRSKEIQI